MGTKGVQGVRKRHPQQNNKSKETPERANENTKKTSKLKARFLDKDVPIFSEFIDDEMRIIAISFGPKKCQEEHCHFQLGKSTYSIIKDF